MKKFLKTVMAVVLGLLLTAGAAAAVFFVFKYYPTSKEADQAEWYGVSGEQTALFLNQERAAEEARCVQGQVYLPLTWVKENLNEKFYWDAGGRQLIYTLPEQIVYAAEETRGSSGAPLFLEENGQVWLLLGLVQTYTDIRASFFDGEVKRLFVDTLWDARQTAVLRRDTPVRVRGGVKSEVLTRLEKGSEVEILSMLEDWAEVRTPDGHIGYLPQKRLGEIGEQVPISSFLAPEYTSISLDKPVVLVWHQVTAAEANQTMKQLMANTKGVNVIAPTWFMLTDNEGSFDSLADRTYVQQAHEMGLQVWAVVDNFNRGENVQSEKLFANTSARKKLIAGLMEQAEMYGIDGINLDIESIKPSAGEHYVQFVRELSVECRKKKIVLSVDTYVPSAYTAFYNRGELGRVTDYVIMMGYDEHYAGGEAGSVASIGYEREGLEQMLAQVSAEKLVCGIPFYTRIWKEEPAGESSQAVGIRRAQEWVKENDVELYWQEELGQYYGEVEKEGVRCRIWMEEERSIGEKMELIREKEIAGVACWKLGFEPAGLWEIVTLP